MRSLPVPDESQFVRVLVDFARELRSVGLAVGSGDVLTYSAAMASLDPTDLLDLYWAGRTYLRKGAEKLEGVMYDDEIPGTIFREAESFDRGNVLIDTSQVATDTIAN